MIKVYVAGPFRGSTPWKVEQNIRAAEAVGLEVAKLGCTPVIPHTMYRHFDKSLPDEFWLEATMDLLYMCDGILMIQGWRRSEGAAKELEKAIEKNLHTWDGFKRLKDWKANIQ